MTTERFLLGRGRDRIADGDLRALEDAVEQVRDLPARHLLMRRGEPVREASFLVDGYVCRYLDDRQGHRQILAVHVPGDFIDLHGYPTGALDHDIATLGPARIATIGHARLDAIMTQRAPLARSLWFSTLLDAAMHREWIFRLGRLGAEGRVAHFFAEIEARLMLAEVALDGVFPLPMTQADLGEACGITGVHANRVLRRLREEGLLAFSGGLATVLDRSGLQRRGEFHPAYLQHRG